MHEHLLNEIEQLPVPITGVKRIADFYEFNLKHSSADDYKFNICLYLDGSGINVETELICDDSARHFLWYNEFNDRIEDLKAFLEEVMKYDSKIVFNRTRFCVIYSLFFFRNGWEKADSISRCKAQFDAPWQDNAEWQAAAVGTTG